MTNIRSESTAVKSNAMEMLDTEILDAEARVPDNVVYRDFVHETVVLNLQTGTYHGLNRTAGVMLETLKSASTVRQAAAQVAEANEWDRAVVERDIVELCRTLAESGLIEIAGGA
jgi:hypothetical protein